MTALLLGRHRLACGDCLDPAVREAVVQGEKPALLYCDPPYGMALDSAYASRGRPNNVPHARVHDYPAVIGDAGPFDPTPLIEAYSHVFEQFWWGADYYRARLPDGGSWLVWDKRRGGGMDRASGSVFELCWSRREHKREILRVMWLGVLGMGAGPEVGPRAHPTQKPVKLAEWFLSRYTKPGDLVLDPYGGAGGMLLACERMGRRCAMIELEPEYCSVIEQRYYRLTRGTAERIAE